MAGSVNKVILVGRLGKDPEIRHSQEGGKIASFTLATSESWKEKNTGEKKERTEWHRIVIFNERLTDVVERFVKKGTQVYLEGQLQTRKWVDNAGQEKYTTEIILSRFRGELTLMDSKNTTEQRSSGGKEDVFDPSKDDFGDEIPF